MSAVVIASSAAGDLARARRELGSAPAGCALVELRADRLHASSIVDFVSTIGRPTIVTVRRVEDGGAFDGSEEERRAALVAALDAGAAFVDVEWNGALADLARGRHASRVILSYHGAPRDGTELDSVFAAMATTGAARLKIVPAATCVSIAADVRRLLERAKRSGRPLACFASGRLGALTRLLAPSWGSWATYASIASGRESAEGQFPAEEMLGLHDVLAISPGTRRFAIVGSRVLASPTPAMHRAGSAELGIDVRCFPVETDAFEPVASLVGAEGVAGIEALAVTMPFKEEAARRARAADESARAAGAVNTVLVATEGWRGFNTDGPAMLDLVRGSISLGRARVAVIGAGGTARAAVAAFLSSGAVVEVYNRGRERRESLASAFGVPVFDLGALERARWDVLVQATPLGRAGEEAVPELCSSGRVVLDAVYGAEPTPLVRLARSRGLVVFDGLDMLVRQALLQLEWILGRRPRTATLRGAAEAWLDRSRAATLPPEEGGTR